MDAFSIIMIIIGLLMSLPFFHLLYVAIRVHLITKRIEKCMSYDCKNWYTIHNLKYKLNKLTQK